MPQNFKGGRHTDRTGIDRPVDDIFAGDQYRASIKHRADANHGPAPLWHGWAIMDAFLAGADYGRANPDKDKS